MHFQVYKQIKGKWVIHIRFNGPLYLFAFELDPLFSIVIWDKFAD